MSQEQPVRPQDMDKPIRFGDIFDVSGGLGSKTIKPQDAAMMQSAETQALGQTQKGGAAAVMESAAARNEQACFVGHYDVTKEGAERGVSVRQNNVPGAHIVKEEVAEQCSAFCEFQVVDAYVQPMAVSGPAVVGVRQSVITVGDALEATIHTAGNKPVSQSDAAAIQAAEIRATGNNNLTAGGVGAAAQSAASFNAGLSREEDKVKLSDVLTGATERLPADKAVTREDAEGVTSAELRNNPNLRTRPGGVSASMAAAARLNESVA
ncbi:Late embryogenesis abundant protein, SMP subgroup domain [Dillenia turbinata]|uniref:Late embryogenesis abundant protein, SMP subgroup domain n=1 Tax=Dillenia turbinata TaxID=194707 RepID=A0AAN8VLP9_9MAGN